MHLLKFKDKNEIICQALKKLSRLQRKMNISKVLFVKPSAIFNTSPFIILIN